jgi:hypothetical protein
MLIFQALIQSKLFELKWRLLEYDVIFQLRLSPSPKQSAKAEKSNTSACCESLKN